MKCKISYLFIILSWAVSAKNELSAQNPYPKPQILQSGDSLFLHGSANEYPHFVHRVRPKETLYSIAKAYGTPMPDILEHNPSLDGPQLPLDFRLRIPLTFNHFETERNPEDALSTPVFWKVQKGQTMFSLAHRILRIPLLHLLSNNQNNTDLSPDQILLVGWLTPSPATSKPVENDLYVPEPPLPNSSITDASSMTKRDKRKTKQKTKKEESAVLKLEESPATAEVDPTPEVPKKMRVIKGAAQWKPSQSYQKGYFVLSSDLPKNKEVEIYNPMSRKSVFATVVGTIPPGMFEDHIVAVVSEDIASDLLALDQTFYMHLRYLD